MLDLTVDGAIQGGGTLGTVSLSCNLINDTPATDGDFNRDDLVNHDDVHLLCLAIRSATSRTLYDVNEDNAIDPEDMTHLIQGIMKTSFGDANLDGRFDSSDFVQVFVAGAYEDHSIDATWAMGDWNCDGKFDSSDLVLAFKLGGYTTGAATA